MTELPRGWAWSTLDELQAPEERAITDGPFGSNLTSTHYTDYGARVIRLQNIGDGAFVDEYAYISLAHFETLRKHEVREGDLLVASLGENPPRACLVPPLDDPALVKADCIRIRLHPQIESRWVLFALLAPATKRYAAKKIRGVGRPRLGLNEIRKIPIPIPPLAEQRRFVTALEGHLSRLDAATGIVVAARRRLAMLRKRLLVEAVPVPPPAHWESRTVAEAGTVSLGRQRHPDWHQGSHMRPYLRVANVFEDRIDLRDVMEMDFPPEVFERFRLHPGDILLNEGQSPELLGRPAMYRGDPPDVAFTNSLLRFRAGPGVDPDWALLVFRRHMHAGRFTKEVRITTNIAHLSATRFKTVEFPVPPVDVQKAIVYAVREQLALVDKLDASLEHSMRDSAALRRALLTEAFAGRLVAQDPADEPAVELLARIRAERASAKPARRARSPRTPKQAPAHSPSVTDGTYQQEELPL